MPKSAQLLAGERDYTEAAAHAAQMLQQAGPQAQADANANRDRMAQRLSALRMAEPPDTPGPATGQPTSPTTAPKAPADQGFTIFGRPLF
jgi:hypothetical protein